MNLIETFKTYANSVQIYVKTANIATPHYSSKRKIEYQVGRQCAEAAIKEMTKNKGKIIDLKQNKDGSTQWPTGVTGSITHSQNIILAIVASSSIYSGLGIDIEKIIDPIFAKKLITRIANKSEQQLLNKNLSISTLASIIFSGKETLFKALYPLTHKRFYCRDAEIIAIDHNKKQWQIRLLTTLSTSHNVGQIYHGKYFINQQLVISYISI